MKIVFMGTPDFAVPCLKALVKQGHQLIGVVTQPDRPKGRGQKITPSPVKVAALEYNIPVYQPPKIKTPEFTGLLRELAPEVIVVVAFGQLLSKEILNIPPKGCINVHASLLPHYRGAAPLHWAIINGEKETGVTTMYMEEGLDTGDMILKSVYAIAPQDTTGVIHDRLAEVGGELLAETLNLIGEGKAPRLVQDESQANYAPLLKKEHELIDWSKPAWTVRNLIRGMNPWPGAYTYFNDKIMKIWQAEEYTQAEKNGLPGEIVEVLINVGFVVQTGQGQLIIKQLQYQGGRQMGGADFLRGNPMHEGMKLGKDF